MCTIKIFTDMTFQDDIIHDEERSQRLIDVKMSRMTMKYSPTKSLRAECHLVIQ